MCFPSKQLVRRSLAAGGSDLGCWLDAQKSEKGAGSFWA